MNRNTYTGTHRKSRRKWNVPLIALLLIVAAGAIAVPVAVAGRQGMAKKPAAAKTVSVSQVKAAQPSKPAQESKPATPATTVAKADSSPVQPVQVSLQDAVKPLSVTVSIEKQVVTVYDAKNRVVESYLCSTGSPGYDTPKGTFTVYNRGKSFFSQKYQEGGYYWVAFYEDYYFHSVPFDKNGNIITKVANDLGHEDSHGCVHLSIPNSEWMYDNIPNGTKVVVE